LYLFDFQCIEASIDCVTGCVDSRQINKARSLDNLWITMEDIAPNQSTVMVAAGDSIYLYLMLGF